MLRQMLQLLSCHGIQGENTDPYSMNETITLHFSSV